MSTFEGVIHEFPFIQIDYFRKSPDRPAPLACFLSHVHSDHLQGLESFRAPFIYCSAATRELLLRIEKYPHRMNFSKGILGSRQLHYKHLSKLLRPIPLNSPTVIELTPRLSIRVTLLDANHCTGAVMFLIEGDGNAILYTGDIRAEPWWVNSLVRHPILLPYTLGSKRLDNIYLDTTFASASHIYRTFPSKAEGLAELLQKVASYPDDTVFYFRAWTFGYEEVWMALSAFLNSKIHVDRYQIGLYRSLTSRDGEGSALCGFELGNRFIPGCLSEDEHCRIHSCEPGVRCASIPSPNTVYITPIVNRTADGTRIPEEGAGGGGGDLYQVHELELPDQSAVEQLEQLCLERITDEQVLTQMRQRLTAAFHSGRKTLPLDASAVKDDQDVPLEHLVNMLTRRPDPADTAPLPRTIHFPYSRHSSYSELCALVAVFKPKDVIPCTVDPLNWDEDVSMQYLFGHLCSGNTFVHDEYMRMLLATDGELRARKRARKETDSFQSTQSSRGDGSHPVPPVAIPSSSDGIPVPSSLETIDDPVDVNLPIVVSAAPEREHAKRRGLRRAWDVLAASRADNVLLAPLPWTDGSSSLPGESQDTHTQDGQPAHTRSEDGSEESPSQTLSISSSAFASQEKRPNDDLHDGLPDADTAVGGTHSLQRSTSARTRRAAYLAARADSYEAWAAMSLVSAGNNHAEEEIEL
ncbi:beta-lactamase-like protein [Aspergillus floccosus]